MNQDDRVKIVIDSKNEMRTKETSKMISEGGLGARFYYDIIKSPPPKEELQKSNN